MSETCKWCGGSLPLSSTPGNRYQNAECDDCWEMRTRIDKKPLIAYRMLDMGKIYELLGSPKRASRFYPRGCTNQPVKRSPEASQTLEEDK